MARYVEPGPNIRWGPITPQTILEEKNAYHETVSVQLYIGNPVAWLTLPLGHEKCAFCVLYVISQGVSYHVWFLKHVRSTNIINITESPVHDSDLHKDRPNGGNNLTGKDSFGRDLHIMCELNNVSFVTKHQLCANGPSDHRNRSAPDRV